jgi:Cu/Ag efflux protein CusF
MEVNHAGREILSNARSAEAQPLCRRKPEGHKHLTARPGRIADQDGEVASQTASIPNKARLKIASSAGTNLVRPELSPIPQRGERAMKLANIMIAGAAVLTIVSSSALAQQALTGTVTRIDRLNSTVAIQQTQSGTVGAAGGGTAEEFKVQNGASLDAVHAGDKVNFSATTTGATKTITKLERQ